MKSLNLQDASCFLIQEIVLFHDYVIVVLIFVLCSVLGILINIILSNVINRFFLLNEKVEFVWTILPSIILFIIALPSLNVLYYTDAVYFPELTLKVVGHQWYWSYEYPEFNCKEFDSYLLDSEQLSGCDFRQLEVDNRVFLPLNTNTRVLVTSSDVIHSWTVPVLGVNIDCIPGRINQFCIESIRSGVFFGQCSEICGAMHSYMPVCLEVVEMSRFIESVNEI